MVVRHIWSNEEKEYLKEIVYGRSWIEIQELMNKKFEYQFNLIQIQNAIKRYKLSTGKTGRFEIGHIPHHQGTKGLMKATKTSFKKGSTPVKTKPIGSERVDWKGYTNIKVAEPNIWKHKHRVLYEQHHNVKLKNTDLIIFLDKDKSNLDIDNLYKLTRQQLIILNKEGLIQKNGELTRTGISITNILLKLKELTK